MRLFLHTLALGACLLAAPFHAAHAQTPSVRFVVFGDLQDTSRSGRAADRQLIAQINRLNPDFSVFIGDIKGGDGDCSDKLIAEMRRIFDQHTSALVYTPGDNEWTDCWRDDAGGHDPRERQAAVVSAFTADGRSIGRQPLALTQQKGRRENARWFQGGVVFATLHMTGTNNNLRQDADAVAEHFAREADNAAWLSAAFETADAQDAAGVVLFTHANPQWDAPKWSPTGFDAFRDALRTHAAAFARPILVVHGDTHTFRLDHPFAGAPNVMRLEVYGPPDRGAVLVEVHPDEPELFRVAPLRHRP